MLYMFDKCLQKVRWCQTITRYQVGVRGTLRYLKLKLLDSNKHNENDWKRSASK